MANKNKTIPDNLSSEITEEEKALKIQSLREMISSAEKTIQGAKAMLLQLEGKKKAGRKRKIDQTQEGIIIEGVFDGQIMIGNDGKQYPVPANYASKSKLVEGDLLKLTITPDGSFIYKQIGPAERRHAIGIASQDERGNFYIIADGKPYRILLASITYFKIEPGDEVAIVIPRQTSSDWAAVESVIQKGKDKSFSFVTNQTAEASDSASTRAEKDRPVSLIDEWSSDIEEIEKELKKEDREDLSKII